MPAGLRTIVVVPTLLTTRTAIDEQIERLEIHYLASQDGDLRFALLSDWTDSATETAPGDDDLLGAAADGIAQLNRRYGAASDGPRFFLLHRRRLWNEGQGTWIGWERKRGKLHELNRWLRGATDTTFVPINGAASRRALRRPLRDHAGRGHATPAGNGQAPGRARWRIRSTVRGWIRSAAAWSRGTACFSRASPRRCRRAVTRSLFQRVFTSPERTGPVRLRGLRRVPGPVRRRLVHREGHLRRRRVRGGARPVGCRRAPCSVTTCSRGSSPGPDWSRTSRSSRSFRHATTSPRLASIGGRAATGNCCPGSSAEVPSAAAIRHRRAIPLIGRWKMLDNLRRTLSAPAVFLALLAGWMLPLPAAAIWSGFVVATFAIPPLLPVCRRDRAATARPLAAEALARGRRRFHPRAAADRAAGHTRRASGLVDDRCHRANVVPSVREASAAARVDDRRAVEGQRSGSTLRGTYWWMARWRRACGRAPPSSSRACSQQSWPIAAPFLILWILSPVVARWASLPRGFAGATPISDADARVLRLTARRTWRFFETFVTAERSWTAAGQLPGRSDAGRRPSDVAHQHRALPAVGRRRPRFRMAGHASTTVDRLEATLATMNSLERFHGHFYNWYDTHGPSSARAEVSSPRSTAGISPGT